MMKLVHLQPFIPHYREEFFSLLGKRLKEKCVGKNLERGQGMCGASSGSIPTDVGQPAIRVSQITVGGTANE